MLRTAAVADVNVRKFEELMFELVWMTLIRQGLCTRSGDLS